MMLNVELREEKKQNRSTKEASLWRSYRRKATRVESEAGLVEQYLPLVKTVVGRLQMSLPSHVDAEDLYSAGLVGLLDAIRHYNPKLGSTFETYARVRIRGAVFDELRRMDWVPRSIHSKAKKVQEAIKQGAITREYRADVGHVVRALNSLRSTEIMSYLQYMQHQYMAVSLLSPGMKTEFAAHAPQELDHANRLADRVQQLGGVPIYDPKEISCKAANVGVSPEQGATLAEMVTEDLMLERQQIEVYTALIREIGDHICYAARAVRHPCGDGKARKRIGRLSQENRGHIELSRRRRDMFAGAAAVENLSRSLPRQSRDLEKLFSTPTLDRRCQLKVPLPNLICTRPQQEGTDWRTGCGRGIFFYRP